MRYKIRERLLNKKMKSKHLLWIFSSSSSSLCFNFRRPGDDDLTRSGYSFFQFFFLFSDESLKFFRNLFGTGFFCKNKLFSNKVPQCQSQFCFVKTETGSTDDDDFELKWKSWETICSNEFRLCHLIKEKKSIWKTTNLFFEFLLFTITTLASSKILSGERNNNPIKQIVSFLIGLI